MSSEGNRPSNVSSARGKRLADVFYWLLLVGGCAVFLLMNLYTTIKEDDLFHSSIGSRSLQPITGLLDVWRSWVDYYRFDPRTSNFLSFLFDGVLGKSVFNVCNTLVFGLMAHIFSRLTTGRNSAMALVMLYTYMVTRMPVPGETMLWMDGSFNYLWCITASLLMVAYLMKHRDRQPGWLKGVALLILALFVGGMNEGTTFGVFGGLCLYYLFNRDKVDRTVVIVMTGYLLGVILLITCPGAWERASSEVTHDAGFMPMMAGRSRLLLDKSIQYITPAVAVIILIVSLAVSRFRKLFTATPLPWIFVVLMAFAFIVGKDQQRPFFAVSMVGLILVVMAIYAVIKRVWWLQLLVIIGGLALCVKCYPANIRTMKQYQEFFNQVEADIRQTPDRQVILKVPHFDGYSRFIKYLNFDSWNYLIREETLCFHYDKDNIQFVNDSVYNAYHEGRLLDGAVPVPFEARDCEAVQEVFALPARGYVAVQMSQDTISYAYQFAQAFQADGTPMPFPVPYLPLLYQGHEYLIFPSLDEKVARLSFNPFTLEGAPIDLVLGVTVD